MSMPSTVVTCEKCQYSGSTIRLWGSYQYSDGQTSVYLKHTLGWCNSCSALTAIEDFSDEKELLQLLDQERKNLEKRFLRKVAIAWSSRKKDDMLDSLQEIERCVARLVLIGVRRGTERCLVCGSSQVFSLENRWKLESFDGTYVESRRTGFMHPGCEGEFVATHCEYYFNILLFSRYYDFSGAFLKKHRLEALDVPPW